MTASRPKSAASRLAEAHLGDRLSALVDGELGHDTRERVLAHVATCPKCKAEVDAQRRLKNVFAEVAPPPPSESFLARLQGLPGGGDPSRDGDLPPFGGGSTGRGLFGTGGPGGARRQEPFSFGYVPARSARTDTAASALAPSAPDRGFRVHPVTRPDVDRSASRGLRFAVAAAGAVSLAAVALGGVTTGLPSDPAADARGGSGTGSNVTPARSAGTGGTTAPETQRRRSVGPLLVQGTALGETPAAPTSVSAPLLPGAPAPATVQGQDLMHTLTTPVMAGAAAMSPLIRPLGSVPPIALTAWTPAPQATGPGLLAAPVPDSLSAPSATSATSSSSRPAP